MSCHSGPPPSLTNWVGSCCGVLGKLLGLSSAVAMVESLLHAGYCNQRFTCIISFILQNNQKKKVAFKNTLKIK